MSHDVLSVSTPTAARFRAPASDLPAANAAPAENAAYAADAFVAAPTADRRPIWAPPAAPAPLEAADLKVMKAQMRVLQAQVALANARIERLLEKLAALEGGPTPAEAAAPEAPAPAEAPTADARPFDQTYTIVWGDTLSGLAQRFGTTVDALAEANGIADPNLIYAGATLMVPAAVAPTAPAAPVADALTSVLAAPAAAAAPELPVADAPALPVADAPALPPLPIPAAA